MTPGCYNTSSRLSTSVHLRTCCYVRTTTGGLEIIQTRARAFGLGFVTCANLIAEEKLGDTLISQKPSSYPSYCEVPQLLLLSLLFHFPFPPPSSRKTMGAISKRVRIYTKEDVEEHNNTASCWVSRKGKVYNITKFLVDHPGGDEAIMPYAGKDVEEVMNDTMEHDHSESAYEMLEEYIVGRLGAEESIIRDGMSKRYLRGKVLTLINWLG